MTQLPPPKKPDPVTPQDWFRRFPNGGTINPRQPEQEDQR